MSTVTSGFMTSANQPESETVSPPIRVLLVDDDEDYYVLTRALLSDIEGQAYDLDWKVSYDEALTALQRDSYDVCLLDYQLGGRNGLDVLEAVRERGDRTPLIMLTGHGDRRIDQAAMLAGAADYLFKAKTDAALLERSIRYALDRTKSMNALRESEARLAALYEQEQARARELEHAYAELHRAEALRDDLTDMIVHDLRGPLTVITVNLDLIGQMLGQSAPATISHSISNARTATLRIATMIDDLLTVSKLEAGRWQLNLTPLPVADWLFEKREMYRAQLNAAQLTLDLHTPARLPLIWVDIDLIGRVLDNLIGNAIKYTPAGGHIDITAEANDQALTLYVQDNGAGIRPDERERIFEKFARGTSSNTPLSHQGAGLGLAFCRLAVAAHGGTITADGTPGHGTTFTVKLPINQ
ncbi:MAG TPA: hybrid sensor histidine kinase/response regulator [Anaerolineae bacterium]|nr:hybrid sensor histidine kinase/response regulator [Anaerolineae bacterium]